MAKPIQLPHFSDFLKNKGHKRKTVKEYCYYLNKFRASHFVLNMETVNDFLSDPANQNSPARAFVKNYITFLKINKKFYELTTEEYQDIIEIELPRMSGRKKIRLPRYLTEEQIKKLEVVLDNERERLSLLISYYCGLRLGELMKITVYSFNWEKWKKTNYEDFGEVKVLGKGDKEGIALVPCFLMKRIANYVKSNKWYAGEDFLFLYSKKLTNIDGQCTLWGKRLRRAGVRAGISRKDDGGKIIEGTQVHPHLLRHSYGASLMLKGVDIRKIQELLRHASISSTQIYAHVEKEHLKDALRETGFGSDENTQENTPKSPNSPIEPL